MNRNKLSEAVMWLGAAVILIGVLGLPGNYFQSGLPIHNDLADVMTILLGSLAFPSSKLVKITARR
jgi:hypothetical protein